MKNVLKFLITAAVFITAVTFSASIYAFAQDTDTGEQITARTAVPEVTVGIYSQSTEAVRVTVSSDECSGWQVAYSPNSDMSEESIMTAEYGAANVRLADLEPGKYYYVMARAYVVDDGVYTYGEWSSVLQAATKPETVTLSYKSRSSEAIRVVYSSAQCSGYQIRYSQNSDMSSAQTVTKSASSSEARLENLKSGTKYYIQIRAYIKVNGEYIYSAWSNKVTNATKPEAVTLAFKSRSSEAIRVVYSTTQCSGYQIRYSQNSDMSSAKTVTKSASSSEARLANLKSGTKYYVQIRSYVKLSGEYVYSAWSNKVKNVTKPAQVSISSLTTPSQTSLKVKWAGVTCTGYQVQYSKNSDFSGKKSVYVTDAKSLNIKSLTTGTTYYVRVRAYKTYDGTKYYGAWSSTKKQKVYKSQKIVTSTYIQKSANWSSSSLCSAASGKSVRLISKSGNWYKVQYGDYTGYIYNLAFKKSGASNLSRSNITAKNYKTYLDDIIFTVGKGRADLYKYVINNMSYSYSKISQAQRKANINSLSKVKDNEAELTAVALKQKGGICYNFAALTKTLLERAGYDVQYVYGSNKNGSHCWVIINTSDGYRHIDTVRKAYLYTDKQMKSSSNTKDFSWNASNYPKCV